MVSLRSPINIYVSEISIDSSRESRCARQLRLEASGTYVDALLMAGGHLIPTYVRTTTLCTPRATVVSVHLVPVALCRITETPT